MIDGVIKYNFDFKPSLPLNESKFTKIELLRERLFTLGLIGVTEDGIGYGNISNRLDKERFVITGTQTGHLAQLNASHYALVEAYDDKQFYLKSTGSIKPSSEALTHGTIYNLSEEIGAVIHIHSKVLWNFMLLNGYLETEDVEYGSLEMIEEVERLYASVNPLLNPKFVMAGHEEGVMFFGQTLHDAELTLYEIIEKLLLP